MQKSERTRVAIIGYGLLGQYLTNALLNDASVSASFELVLVWNRSADKLDSLPEDLRYTGPLDQLFDRSSVDPVVEVCHPSITQQYGAYFLRNADLFVGSPTAFADAQTEATLRKIASEGTHGIYVPSGAL